MCWLLSPLFSLKRQTNKQAETEQIQRHGPTGPGFLQILKVLNLFKMSV